MCGSMFYPLNFNHIPVKYEQHVTLLCALFGSNVVYNANVGKCFSLEENMEDAVSGRLFVAAEAIFRKKITLCSHETQIINQ